MRPLYAARWMLRREPEVPFVAWFASGLLRVVIDMIVGFLLKIPPVRWVINRVFAYIFRGFGE